VKPIAVIRTPFGTAFGIPRQPGLVAGVPGRIVFARPYRVRDAFKGLEGFSHVWVLWGFSLAKRTRFSPLVRPPRLGGNATRGVFATRSPYRPNPLALSCVRLVRIEETARDGTVLHVAGVDMADGSPVYDVKPYLPYADCVPEATGGFAAEAPRARLAVEASAALLERLPEDLRGPLVSLLALDPRPPYQNRPEREYGFPFAGKDVVFRVSDGKAFLLDIR
jgi:tRNA-Thr(GGU) m(6)t(6)A37 methyltransferase TsaA